MARAICALAFPTRFLVVLYNIDNGALLVLRSQPVHFIDLVWCAATPAEKEPQFQTFKLRRCSEVREATRETELVFTTATKNRSHYLLSGVQQCSATQTDSCSLKSLQIN